MINNNSGNKNKNVTFYKSMYIFLILIQVNVYFLLTFFIINRGEYIFIFNTNTGQCIFFTDLFYH